MLALVQRVLVSKHVHRKVSDGWWASFNRRHPDLSLRNPAPLSMARAAATDCDIIDRCFDLLEEIVDAHDLRSRPCLILGVRKSRKWKMETVTELSLRKRTK